MGAFSLKRAEILFSPDHLDKEEETALNGVYNIVFFQFHGNFKIPSIIFMPFE